MKATALWGAGLLTVIAVLASGRAWPHPAGVTATDVYLGAERIELVYTVPTRDLWRVVGGEEPDGAPPPETYAGAVRSGFRLENAGQRCTLQRLKSEILDDIGSYEYRLQYQCPRPLDSLTLRYGLFVEFDRAHRNLLRVFAGELGTRSVLNHAHRTFNIPVAELRSREDFALPELTARPRPPGEEPRGAGAFFGLGVEHIVTGYDHLLFLAGLVLVSLRLSSIAVLVTAFTLAHSITLGMAALQVFEVPAVVTESLIALSVTWVGAANMGMVLRRVSWRSALELDRQGAAGFRAFVFQQKKRRWLLTFAFGLIHGVGFAGMLRQIGLPEDSVVSALAMFNVGVEAGQLAAVALAYPVLRLLARHRTYPVVVLFGSAGLAVVGLLWFWLRVTA